MFRLMPRNNPDVGLKLTKDGKVVVDISAGEAIANEAGRIYYSIDDLAEMYSKDREGNIPAEEQSEPIPLPEEEPEQPEEPSEDVPEEEEVEEVLKPEQPLVEETEEESSEDGAKGMAIIIAVIAAISVSVISIIIFRKKKLN